MGRPYWPLRKDAMTWLRGFLEIKVCRWISDPSKQIHAFQCACVQVIQKKNLFYNVTAFNLKIPSSQLSSAIYKLVNGISIVNIPITMLLCLIGGYYDIGACDYIKIIFLLSIKVINHILGALEFNLKLMCFYITCWHYKRGWFIQLNTAYKLLKM